LAPAIATEEYAAAGQPNLRAPAPAKLGGTVGLSEIVPSPIDATSAQRMLRADTPFAVELALDLSQLDAPANIQLHYLATLSAKRIGESARLTIGQASGELWQDNATSIRIESGGLPRGLYRMEAAVQLTLQHMPDPAALCALLEGGHLQIY
jgi:hypothetical protein